MTTIASLFGVVGQNGGSSFQPLSFDVSVLATPAAPQFQTPPKAFDTPITPTPFEAVPASLSRRVSEARGLRQFIDTGAPEVTRAGADPDLQTSFALYRGLRHLQALAEFAGQKGISATERAGLAKSFNKGLAEVRQFVSSAETDKLALLFGAKSAKVESMAAPRIQRAFQGAVVQKNEVSAALPGLDGSERFTISLDQGGNSQTFTIDLAQITGARSLGAVVGLINRELSAPIQRDVNGNPVLDKDGKEIPIYRTRAAIEGDAKTGYSLKLELGAGETVTLGAEDAEDGIMALRQTSPATGASTAALVRLDAIAGDSRVGMTQEIAGLKTGLTRINQAAFDAGPAQAKRPAGAPKPAAPAPVKAETQAAQAVVDSQGFTWVVGSAEGDIGGQTVSGRDLFLTKYDTQGKAVFSRVIGNGADTQGFALTVDAQDNVIVAGQTSGRLNGPDAFSGQDSFVAKFSKEGRELLTVKLDSVGMDRAQAVTADADGNIYIAGVARGAVQNGAPQQGGDDVFVVKLDGKPRVVEGLTTRVLSVAQFGSAAHDTLGGLALDDDGTLLLASTEDGRGTIRRLSAADLTSVTDQTDLGDLAGGRLTGLALDTATGAVAVAGVTRTDAINAGPVTGTLAGANDGFVARLDDQLNGQGTTLLASSGTESMGMLAFSGGKIYAAGTTSGELIAERRGPRDAFIARLDAAGGALERVTGIGAAGESTAGVALAVAPRASSATLQKLGLRAGVLNERQSTDLMSQTPLRPGDTFRISVNGQSPRTISISENETIRSLARKLNSQFRGAIDAKETLSGGGARLELRAQEGSEIDLIAGPQGRDALAKLGMGPAKLLHSSALFDIDESKGELKPGGAFALGLDEAFDINDAQRAAYVSQQLSNAMSTVQRAYRSLYYDPNLAASRRQGSGQVPEYLTRQLANLQDGLFRLGGGVSI